MNTGDILKANGMKAALLAKHDWSIEADRWFQSLPDGAEFTSEDLTNAIGFPTTSSANGNNAIGAKIRTWADKRTEKVGYKKTIRTISHSRMIVIWRKK